MRFAEYRWEYEVRQALKLKCGGCSFWDYECFCYVPCILRCALHEVGVMRYGHVYTLPTWTEGHLAAMDALDIPEIRKKHLRSLEFRFEILGRESAKYSDEPPTPRLMCEQCAPIAREVSNIGAMCVCGIDPIDWDFVVKIRLHSLTQDIPVGRHIVLTSRLHSSALMLSSVSADTVDDWIAIRRQRVAVKECPCAAEPRYICICELGQREARGIISRMDTKVLEFAERALTTSDQMELDAIPTGVTVALTIKNDVVNRIESDEILERQQALALCSICMQDSTPIHNVKGFCMCICYVSSSVPSITLY
jgi:hypothetical protein